MSPRGVAAFLVVATAGALLVGLACGGGAERSDSGASAQTFAAVPEARAAAGAPDEAARRGEAIYRREHCDRCHTLFETPPAEGAFDLPRARPPAPDDSRVGPDLGREGHRHGDDWHYAHLYAPDIVVPGSRMPASRHLFETAADGAPRPTEDGRHLVGWLQRLGRERRDVWAEFRALEPDIPPRATGEEAATRRRGRAGGLYAAHCLACHGAAGDGRGAAAPLLARPPRDLRGGAFRFRSVAAGETLPDTDLFRTITLGSGTGAAMPAFAYLPAEDRWALVESVRDFAKDAARTGAATPDATRASGLATAAAPELRFEEAIARGRHLYAAWGCAACHGAGGEGRAAPDAAPGAGPAWRDEQDRPIERSSDLRHACGWRGGASVAAIERALRFGVGPAMPSYAALLDADPGAAAALRAYLLTLDPERAAPAPASGG
jgi:cbb3-type cytochrome oxidase cytochrome c subunit